MKIDKIYIVKGFENYHADHQEWIVKAFKSKEKALDLCDHLNKWLLDNCYTIDNFRAYSPNDVRPNYNPKDPKFENYFNYSKAILYQVEDIDFEP